MKLVFLVAAVLLITALTAGYFLFQSIDRGRLTTAREELDQQDFLNAASSLESITGRHPSWTEAWYLLGRCQAALGRPEEALVSWDRIPAGSLFSPEALLDRARIEERLGALRLAEMHSREVLATRSPLRVQARRDLIRMLRAQGRFAEALDLHEAGRSEADDLMAWIRDRYRYINEPLPTEGLEAYFAKLATAPLHDDRVVLGQANLDILLGRFDQADHHITALEKAAPDDRPVLLARIRWGFASDRLDVVFSRLARLRPSDLTDSERVDLALWLTSKHAHKGEQYQVLANLANSLPGRSRLIDRLAALASETGRPEVARKLRSEKNQNDKSRDALERWIKDGAHSQSYSIERLLRGANEGDGAELLGLAPIAGRSGNSSGSLADLLSPATQGLEASTPLVSGRRALLTPRFRDLAGSVGLKFSQFNGSGEGTKRRLIPPITGSGGVALIDYDSDGRLDVYAVQGGPFPPVVDPKAEGDRLFHQQPDGRFVDVTERAGLGGRRGYGHGVAVGDFDGDRLPDLFVTRWRSYSLYRNKGDGTFEDVTASVGLGGDRDWPTSAAFADLDNDGDLDLYVTHYLKWDENDARPCVDKNDPTIYNCSPKDFDALPDHLFRNDGGKFVDISKSAGIVDKDGRGWGVVANDFDGDGKMDLYVANDLSANYLFRNLGDMKFEEVALTSGASANGSGNFQAGMGVASADLDGDGLPDLAVTNFFNESTTLFRNLGNGFFGDQTAASGLAAPSRYLLGFGVAFLDANNDGNLDLITANGHVHDGRPQFPYDMPLQLLLGDGTGRVVDVSKSAGEPFLVNRLGRGLAVGDLDNDGRTDVVVLSQNGPLAYLRNETEPRGRSITLLLGGTRSNTDAVGAVVRVRTGQQVRTLFRVGGGGFQSANDPRLQIGLGSAERADSVEIQWPSGQMDRYADLPPGGYRLTEGKSAPEPLPAWATPPRVNP